MSIFYPLCHTIQICGARCRIILATSKHVIQCKLYMVNFNDYTPSQGSAVEEGSGNLHDKNKSYQRADESTRAMDIHRPSLSGGLDANLHQKFKGANLAKGNGNHCCRIARTAMLENQYSKSCNNVNGNTSKLNPVFMVNTR